jgi:hypothetical protein
VTGPLQTTGGMMARSTPGGAAMSLFAPLLGMLPPDFAGKAMRPWMQPLQALAVTAAGTAGANANASFNADSSFDYAFFYGSVAVRDATNLIPKDFSPAIVSISDTANQFYNPTNLGNDIDNVFGSGRQPVIWIAPLIVRASTGINIAVQNLDNETLNFRFTLMGLQVPAGR